MAKETVKVSKTKGVPQAKKAEVAKQPEPFGMLFEPLASVRRDIDRFFENLSPSFPRGIEFDPFRQMGSMFGLTRGDLTPHVEVTEQDKSYEISAELPGVDEKDVTITLENHMLTISGEKKTEREETKKDYFLSERSYGSFHRSFRVPENVDEDKISAAFDKGVMTVVLPKLASAKRKGRSIPIK